MSTDSLAVSLTLPVPCVSEQAHGDVARAQVADEALTELVAQLYQQHAKAICVYIHSLVGEWATAHDLTQEAFLQLHRTRARLPQVENQRAWLYGVASHVALNALKRQRRFAWLPWHTAENEAQLAMPDMEQEVAGRAAVERALATLSPEYRAPLLLYSSYGLSVREVAAALALSEGAVKTRLHRARELFRQSYGEQKE